MLHYSALVFSLASLLDMPARTKKAEAVTNIWRKRKEKVSPSSRPKKLKAWSNASMLLAITAVRDGTMSSNMASRTYNVPPSTLKDRISGRVKHGTKPGPIPYLTEVEEKELHDFLVKAAAMGCGKTKKEVFSILERTLKKKGSLHDHFNGEGWWIRFMERYPRLSLRSTDALSRMRANAITKENMDHYFTLLRQTLTDNNLLDKPAYIYNMDESGMPLDHNQPKRIAPKGMRKVHGLSSGNKTQITIVACGNAAGQMLPPMVILKGERFNHEWTEGEVPNTLYGMSENGWIDQELYNSWFEKLFIPSIPPHRPVNLMLDGHKSHYTPEAISLAANQGIVILCIPPNTTHATQPLDVSFFKPLKANWSSVCYKFMTDNPGAVVTKLGFPKLFSQAWYQAIKPENLISGFRKTGVCPFKSEAVSVYEIPSGDLFSDDDKLPSENTSQVQEPSSLPVISDEQISLFDTRYENGYDLCTDEDYVDWVNINHPGFLPTTSDVQIPVHTEPSVSDTLAASRMILSDSPLHRLQLSETKISGKPHPPINDDHTHRLITMNIINCQLITVQQPTKSKIARQEELNVIIIAINGSSPQPKK